MTAFRHISFYALVAGACGLIVVQIVHAQYWQASFLFITGVLSEFGLLAWVVAFLKVEPTRSRIALVMVFVFLAFVCWSMATSAD